MNDLSYVDWRLQNELNVDSRRGFLQGSAWKSLEKNSVKEWMNKEIKINLNK